jgi:hypothetical protein
VAPLENRKTKAPTGILRVFADQTRQLEGRLPRTIQKGKLESKLNYSIRQQHDLSDLVPVRSSHCEHCLRKTELAAKPTTIPDALPK